LKEHKAYNEYNSSNARGVVFAYLDNAASTKVRPEAIKIMSRVMSEDYGNPSSMHACGRKALRELEHARANISSALGTDPKRLSFTSGGTEANNLAILGIAHNLSCGGKYIKGRHIISSAIEHSSVKAPIKKLESCGFEVTWLSPDKSGHIPLQAFAGALREDTVFASIMLVNNETGIINPVGEYAAEIKRRKFGTILHTDAVQGFCKIPFTVKLLGADLVSVSSHKLHGPKGAGALYVGERAKLTAIIIGGEQEKGIRGGTEALPAIAGFGEAARLARFELETAAGAARDLRERTVSMLKSQIPQIVIIGGSDSPDNPISPYILSVSLPGFKSEVLMNYLDGEGICVSKGAACKKGARSPTLEAMGLEHSIIDGALRISFSRFSTLEEAEYFVHTLEKAAKTLLK